MTYILYHDNCYDGFGAAFCCWLVYQDRATYIPCNYAQGSKPLEAIPDGSQVYIVDFSFPREALLQAKSRFSSLTVLDHHKSAQSALEGLGFCKFDLTKSGALLTFEYFQQSILDLNTIECYTKVEKLIQYISDRDLWKFEFPETKLVHAALCSHPMVFEVWDKLELAQLIVDGGVLLRAKEMEVERICSKAMHLAIGEYIVPVVNTSVHFSEAPNRLLELHPEAKFAAYYYDYLLDGRLVRQYGLRSRPDFDVSLVAQKFGGGGHAQASGFVVDLDKGPL